MAAAAERDPSPINRFSSQEVLDALVDAIVIVDADITIVAVNQAWRDLCVHNGADAAVVHVGLNYADVCGAATDMGSTNVAHAVDCVRRVLGGEVPECLTEYGCTSTANRRRFVLRVTQVDGSGAMASHVDITAHRQAERAAAIAAGLRAADEISETSLGIAAFDSLSRQEREVVVRLLRGYRVNAIAAELFVSPSTVRSQLSSAYSKLRVSSQQELIELVRADLLASH